MKLEDFLKNSVLPGIQVSSLYFKPAIPPDALANAIKEYAPGIGMSSVVALLDESFWGNGKEGMLVTNDEIILSKKFGKRVISFSSIDQIHINDKHFIINDIPITKFNKPEVMPLGCFGSVLNDFFLAMNRIGRREQDISFLTEVETDKLASFLCRITEPLYFESTPVERRIEGAVTVNYALSESITETEKQLLSFTGGFAPGESLLCVSWLGAHDAKNSFFCVTNRGVYSVLAGSQNIFISHEDLRHLNAIEEYEERRYVALRLSDGCGIIVSIQNAYMRPYALELFSGLINILNGLEPDSREVKSVSNQSSSSTSDSPVVEEGPIKDTGIDSQLNSYNTLPLRVIDNDALYEMILKINSIDNVGDFIGSILSSSDRANSSVRKKFQSYVARTCKSFRKELVELSGFHQFKNDVATMEVCGAVVSYAFILMHERGVKTDIAQQVLFEGIAASLALKGGLQKDPHGVAILKIVESYISREGLEDFLFNMVFRLIGSNLSGKLRPDYSDVLKDCAHLLEDFVPTMDPGLTKFLSKIQKESSFLVDEILDVRW